MTPPTRPQPPPHTTHGPVPRRGLTSVLLLVASLWADTAIDAAEIKVLSDFPGGSVVVRSVDQDTRTVRILPGSPPDRGWACWWYFKLVGVEHVTMLTIEVAGYRTVGEQLGRSLKRFLF